MWEGRAGRDQAGNQWGGETGSHRSWLGFEPFALTGKRGGGVISRSNVFRCSQTKQILFLAG